MGSEKWDAIVIGSGLGGLTTAAYLQTNGLRTLVLEQWEVAGGSSHVFRRKNQWEFDVGVHYLGDCGPNGVFQTTLRGVGLEGKVEFLEMDPDGFDTLMFPDLTFRVPKGWDRYLERLAETFPGERRGLERCVGTLRKIAGEVMRGGTSDRLLDMIRFVVRSPSTVRWANRTLADLFDRCDLSERARAVLAAEAGTYGSPPSEASVLMHAVLMDHYLRDGAYYPKGGGQVFAAHLVDAIRSHGGEVRTLARVEKILVEDGKARGVRLRGGEELRAPVVVSNADLKKTLLEMVGREHVSAKTAERIERYTMALPIMSVYLGLDMDLRDRMPNTNFLVYGDFDLEVLYRELHAGRVPDRLPLYITSASVKDPYTREIAPEGCSSMEIMTMAPADHSFWNVGEGPAAGEKYSRKPEYKAVKERLTDELIDAANRVIPGLKDHILWKEASTPITHERYTLATGGTSYGIELTPRQMGTRRPRPKTEIDGLFLAGASTMYCHGIAGVMFGGVGTASAVLGRDLAAEVRSGRVFGDPAKLTGGGPGWDPLKASRRLSKPAAGRQTPAPAAAGERAPEPTPA